MDTGAPEGAWTLEDGSTVYIRPSRPDDEAGLARFHSGLSERSVYQRYLYAARVEERLRQERMSLRDADADVRGTLVVEQTKAGGAPAEIVAVGHLTALGDGTAQVALVVSDAFQGQGVGVELLGRLVALARDRGLEELVGDLLSDNELMLSVARRWGFSIAPVRGEPRMLRARLVL